MASAFSVSIIFICTFLFLNGAAAEKIAIKYVRHGLFHSIQLTLGHCRRISSELTLSHLIRKGLSHSARFDLKSTTVCEFICRPNIIWGFGKVFLDVASMSPSRRCFYMTATEWSKVGCGFSQDLKQTKICAPSREEEFVMQNVMNAKAVALGNRVLFRKGLNRTLLFNSPQGRALVRHELRHIAQQRMMPALVYGALYMTSFCDSECTYSKISYEVDARKWQRDSCVN